MDTKRQAKYKLSYLLIAYSKLFIFKQRGIVTDNLASFGFKDGHSSKLIKIQKKKNCAISPRKGSKNLKQDKGYFPRCAPMSCGHL